MKRVTIEITLLLLLLLLLLLKGDKVLNQFHKIESSSTKIIFGRSIHLTSSKFYHMLHLSLSPYLSITSHNFLFLFLFNEVFFFYVFSFVDTNPLITSFK